MIGGKRTTFNPSTRDLQVPFDVAVVIPTVLRPTLAQAVRSVYGQAFPGSIQVLVGIDKPLGDPTVVDELGACCPAHCVLTVLDLGYSTSARHGGPHPGGSGGALRTILSYAANSRRVAYLDDDNWWHPGHLAGLCEAVEGFDWAYSLRWFADGDSGRALCVDAWESVGPGAGVFREAFGGFVDPNCLLLDKASCGEVLHHWSVPLPGDSRAMSEDRNVFALLRARYRGRGTGRPTAYYRLQPGDVMHPQRLGWIAEALAEVPPGAPVAG